MRVICAQLIGRAERNEDLPLLRKLARDQQWDVRRAALEALGRFSKEEDLPLLRKALTDEDPNVRCAALEALGGVQRRKTSRCCANCSWAGPGACAVRR